MGAPTPTTLLEAIASSAGGSYITNPIPDAPTGTNAASIQQGFPPTTMTNEQAGGEPPLGQDMNGYLFLISSHTMYVQCGQLYQYNSALATAIGGYLAGSILGMADGTGMWMSLTNGNTANPDTGGAGWIAIASYGTSSVPVTTGVVTLTPAQYRRTVIKFTGTLTGNVTVELPNIVGEWLLVNSTSGAFTLTATAGGSGVVIPQGGFSTPTGVYVVGDTNVYPTVSPLSVAIDQGATPLTLVERTNTGMVVALTLFMTQATENSTVGTVVFQKPGDGTLRNITLTNFEAQLLLQAMGGQVTNGQVPFSVVSQWASALFSSPAFTGVPTAPTAGSGTSSSQVATTAFVVPGSTVTGAGPWIRRNADGSVDQWGTFTYNTNSGAHTINFGTAFGNAIQVVDFSVEAAAVGWDTWIVAGSKTLGGFQINDDATSSHSVTINWRATGR